MQFIVLEMLSLKHFIGPVVKKLSQALLFSDPWRPLMLLPSSAPLLLSSMVLFLLQRCIGSVYTLYSPLGLPPAQSCCIPAAIRSLRCTMHVCSSCTAALTTSAWISGNCFGLAFVSISQASRWFPSHWGQMRLILQMRELRAADQLVIFGTRCIVRALF